MATILVNEDGTKLPNIHPHEIAAGIATDVRKRQDAEFVRTGNVDRRDGPILKHELERMDYQIIANKGDLQEAEREAEGYLQRHKQLEQAQVKVLSMRHVPETQMRADKVAHELEVVDFNLRRWNEKVDTTRRIIVSREKIRKEFLEFAPAWDGAPTNAEIIAEQLAFEKLDRVLQNQSDNLPL